MHINNMAGWLCLSLKFTGYMCMSVTDSSVHDGVYVNAKNVHMCSPRKQVYYNIICQEYNFAIDQVYWQ